MAKESKTAENVTKTEADEIEPSTLTLIDAPHSFASVIQIQSTGNDFTLSFLRTRPLASEKGFAREYARQEVVSIVTMSPQTLKDLSVLLQGQVEKFEAEYGKIKSPYLEGLKKK